MYKNELRAVMKDKRKALCKEEINRVSQKICETVKELYPDTGLLVCAYSAIQNEVDVSSLFSFYKNVYLPITEGEDITFYRLTETLCKGKFNVLEPQKKEKLCCVPDLVLVPGIAFDDNGNRVGYGKGYYDRFLNANPCDAVGIAYAFQVVEKITDVWEEDIRMHKIITERRVIDGTE